MNWFHRQVCRSGRWRRRVKGLLPWVLQSVELGDDALEIGPGPGVTTDLLRDRTRRLTALEVDAEIAAALEKRLDGSGVRVVHGRSRTAPSPESWRSRCCITSHQRRCKIGCWRKRGGCCGPAESSLDSMAPTPFFSGSSIWATRTRQSVRVPSGGGWTPRVLRKWPLNGIGLGSASARPRSNLRRHSLPVSSHGATGNAANRRRPRLVDLANRLEYRRRSRLGLETQLFVRPENEREDDLNRRADWCARSGWVARHVGCQLDEPRK
jgi:Ribosomal RNA adenine dimethylase